MSPGTPPGGIPDVPTPMHGIPKARHRQRAAHRPPLDNSSPTASRHDPRGSLPSLPVAAHPETRSPVPVRCTTAVQPVALHSRPSLPSDRLPVPPTRSRPPMQLHPTSCPRRVRRLLAISAAAVAVMIAPTACDYWRRRTDRPAYPPGPHRRHEHGPAGARRRPVAQTVTCHRIPRPPTPRRRPLRRRRSATSPVRERPAPVSTTGQARRLPPGSRISRRRPSEAPPPRPSPQLPRTAAPSATATADSRGPPTTTAAPTCTARRGQATTSRCSGRLRGQQPAPARRFQSPDRVNTHGRDRLREALAVAADHQPPFRSVRPAFKPWSAPATWCATGS